MSTKYTYSYSVDFNNSVYETQLLGDIDSDAGITPTILRVDRDDDDINIYFDSALSTGEKTVLDALISNYTYTPKVRFSGNLTLHPNNHTFKNDDYSVEDRIIYEGPEFTGDIYKIVDIGNMESKNDGYSSKIYDKTNNKIIAEKSFTNTDLEIITILNITNIPLNESILELHVKSEKKNNKAFINSVMIYLV